MKPYLILILLFFSSCAQSDKDEVVTLSGEAMTIPYRVLVGHVHMDRQVEEIRNVILDTFYEIDLVYNKWNPYSEISKLNHSKAFVESSISEKLEDFLKETDNLISLADGKFDPTIESVQKVWKENLPLGKVPGEDDLRAASDGVGWKKVHFGSGKFWKEHDLLEIDLGAIAKGFAIDLMIERLNDLGYNDAYVEWGGEIRVSGKHPEGRPWKIVITALGSEDQSAALEIVEMKDNAVASSGDYLQNWTVNGTTYFHIIDPKTCTPLVATDTSVCSVTVIAPNCALADFLATAAMLFPSVGEAENWLASLKGRVPGLRYWVISRSDVEKRKAAISFKLDSEPSKGR